MILTAYMNKVLQKTFITTSKYYKDRIDRMIEASIVQATLCNIEASACA